MKPSQRSQRFDCILIVDDDADMLDVLARWCRQEGWQVVTVDNATDGLKVLASRAVDVAVLDLHMPGYHGSKLLKAARESAPDVPLVVLTGFPSVDSAIDAIQWHG